MTVYKETIDALAHNIPQIIVNFDASRVRSSLPTQASSEFITNREQGDWAEQLIFEAINKTNEKLVAVRYGKSDKRVAGEEGFEEFYKAYQDELDEIGKRPDLLLFNVEDYDHDWHFDISGLPNDILADIVPKAVAGLEVRSSSFLIGRYDEERKNQLVSLRRRFFMLRDDILTNFIDILPTRIATALQNTTEDNISDFSYRIAARQADERYSELNNKLVQMREIRDKIFKTRGYLSFTVKVEDLYVVRKWIQTYGVPHYYFQVFFDRVFGMSFEHILQIIAQRENQGHRFTIEKNTKNQFKSTIHMSVREGKEIAYKVMMPRHRSEMKELPRGRLLFHVTFEGGEAFLNLGTLYNLLQLSDEQE